MELQQLNRSRERRQPPWRWPDRTPWAHRHRRSLNLPSARNHRRRIPTPHPAAIDRRPSPLAPHNCRRSLLSLCLSSMTRRHTLPRPYWLGKGRDPKIGGLRRSGCWEAASSAKRCRSDSKVPRRVERRRNPYSPERPLARNSTPGHRRLKNSKHKPHPRRRRPAKEHLVNDC